jgi:Cys-tRNA(Pro)/Cys-tRNA(Cys) deacylase
MITNNVTRLLNARKVTFTAFELPAEKLGAQEAAQRMGVPLHQVFKTIVVVREKPGKPLLAVVPGDHEVDLKAVAALLKEKKVQLPTQREAEQLTGLQAGGISPLALINRGFKVLLDSAALEFEQIHVSGGQRGLNVRLPVKDLVQLTQAVTGVISRPLPDGQDGDQNPL